MTRREASLIAEEVVRQLRLQGLVEDKVLNIEEAAEMLGVSTSYIYQHLNEIPHEKYAKRLRFFRSSITKLIRRVQ